MKHASELPQKMFSDVEIVLENGTQFLFNLTKNIAWEKYTFINDISSTDVRIYGKGCPNNVQNHTNHDGIYRPDYENVCGFSEIRIYGKEPGNFEVL